MNKEKNSKFNPESFLQRNTLLHRSGYTPNDVTEKAALLAEEFAKVIKKHGGSYHDVNQAVIMTDNGFYKSVLKTDCHTATSE